MWSILIRWRELSRDGNTMWKEGLWAGENLSLGKAALTILVSLKGQQRR